MAKVTSGLPSGGTGTSTHNHLLGLNDGNYIHLTIAEKNKLDGIEPGAEVNVNADFLSISGDSQILNLPSTFPPSSHTHVVTDITGTKSQFNNSLTDGNFLFVGDITQYTDELAQDAVGNILTDINTIDLIYNDGLNNISANVKPNSIDASHLSNSINISEFINDADYTTVAASQAYADALVVGLWDDRGAYDASSNLFPSTGGSGIAGAILKGDVWTISVAGTLGGYTIQTRQIIRALTDSPGQIYNNWAIGLADPNIQDSITDGVLSMAPSQNAVYDALLLKENLSNKSTNTLLGTSNILYPTENAVKVYTDSKITQTITDGVLTTAPSEDTVHDALQKKQNLPTGFILGLQLSINIDPTKIDIAPGYYTITDFTDIADPVVTVKTFVGLTGVTPAYLTTANATYIALDINGNVVSSASPFSNSDRRTLAIVGAAIHSNLTTVNVTNEIKAPIIAPTNQLHDFMRAIGFLNEEGNIFSPNGANLQLNKSAGKIFGMGINAADYTNPHQLLIPAQTALTFAYRIQGGTQYANTTSIDPNNWDNANVLTSVPVGNRWTIQRINLFQSGLARIQYGQTVYTSFNAAVTALPTQSFVTEKNIADNAVFRCYLIIQQGTTDLASAVEGGTAQFIPVDKFGNVIGNGSVALTYSNIVAALGYVPANDTDVIHKTGNETKSGSLTLSDELIVSGENGISLNTQAASLKIVDVGSDRNNVTLRAIDNSPGANIRLEVLDVNAHIGFNKGGTPNSSLAFLFDNTTTSGGIDFRGDNYVNATDYSQYSRLYQDGDDFSFRNIKTGSFLFKSAGGINTNLKITNNGEVSIGTGTLFTGSKATIQGDGVILALRNTNNGSTASPISRKISWVSTNDAERAYIDSPDALQDVSGAPIIFGTRNNSGVIAERVRIHNSGGFSVGNTIDLGVGTLNVANNISTIAATTANHVVIKSQLDAAARPYKTYTALLTQTGTNAPVATVLENTLGGTVVWTRNAIGQYLGTLTGAFTINKTTTSANITTTSFIITNRNTVNDVVIISANSAGANTDGLLNGNFFEIRIYN